MHTRTALVRIAITCALLLNAFPAWSTGGRDATFGTLGEVRLSSGVAISTAIQQPDGKVLLAGNTNVPGAPIDLVVVRMLESGSLDTGFGVGGTAQISIGGKSDLATAMVLQSDGRIIVAGCYPPQPNVDSCVSSLIRLNADGTLDPSFGVNGHVIDPTARGLIIKAVAVQADDGIVAVGGLNSAAGDFVVTRLQANGALDTSFGDQGVKVLDWAKGNDQPFDIAIQGDGRILVAGAVGENLCGYWDQKMAVLRLLGDGTLDPSFGTGGWWTYAPDCGGAVGVGLQLLSDGRILLAANVLSGYIGDEYDVRDQIYRLNPNGVLDTTYGPGGHIILPQFYNADFPIRARPASRGLGWLNDAYSSYGYFVALIRLAADGTIDPTIGESGLARIDTNDAPNASISVPCILPLASGQVLVVFSTPVDGQAHNVVVRVRPDDPPAGTVRFDGSYVELSATALTAQIVIHRSGGSQGAVSVHYETIDSGGVGGVDYNAAAGQLDWPDGDATDRQVTISLPRPAQSNGNGWDFYVRLTLTGGEAAVENETTPVVFAGPPPPPPPPTTLPPPTDPATSGGGGGGAMDPAGLALLALIAAISALAPRLQRRRSNKTPVARQRFHSLTILAALLASGFGASATSHAGATRWESVGPAPAPITAAIAADAATHTIYIGNFGKLGVLKSTDDGAHFTPVNDGLDFPDVGAMVMANNNPNTVYVGGGSGIVYKTLSGGAHWFRTGNSDGQGIVALAIDPTDPNIVYAGSAKNGGVWKTVNGGKNWLPVTTGMGGTAVYSIVVDPFHHNVVYAGTLGYGAFKSTNGGASWTALAIDSSVWSLLADPDHSGVIYAGSNGKGVFKSSDGGNTFTRVGSPRIGVVLALAKSGGQLYAGTAGQGVSVSSDDGVTWRNTGITRGLGISLSVDAGGALYLGTNFEGAFVLPSGHSAMDALRGTAWRRLAWTQIKSCACQSSHGLAIDPGDHNHVFFGTLDGGLLVTQDGGRTWSDGGTGGLTTRAPQGIAFDPQDPRRVYAGAFIGSGLYRSQDHGKHWQRRQFGTSAIYTTSVAVDPVNHAVYVATVSGDGIWKSRDYGNTFQRIDRAPGAPTGEFLGLISRGIDVDPHDHNTVYVGSSKGANPGVWRSQDAGRTWIKVDENAAFHISFDPSDASVVYAATAATGVLKSTDGGASFAAMNHGIPDADTSTSFESGIQVDPKHPSVLYVSTLGGVYKSTNGAASWFSFNRGLDDTDTPAIVLDPTSPDTLYAATSASSVYKTVTAHH